MNKKIYLAIAFCWLFISARADDKPFRIEFDEPLYSAGETIWFAIIRTGSQEIEIGNNREIIHFELLSPRNEIIIQGKVLMVDRLAEGYLKLPSNLQEGYYRFRVFTLEALQGGGKYVYADIPIYSEWSENLTVYKYEEDLLPVVKSSEGPTVKLSRNKATFQRRDSLLITDLVSNVKTGMQYVFWITPKQSEGLMSITSIEKEMENPIELNSALVREDSLYFEAFLSDMETGTPVTSPLISIYSGHEKHFYRAKADEGWISLKIPAQEGDLLLQVFNLNPYQSAVNQLQVRRWTINEGYFNPSSPPLTQEIAEYLIKTQKRRKIRDLFFNNSLSIESPILNSDTSVIIPDKYFNMSDYRYINNLQEFIFEAIPGARVLTEENGTQTVRLYNPERKAIFMDRPWYIVDGYLTSRELEVLKIPFKDIDEISLYVDTHTIRNYFEYFLWRNGILEVKTQDVKYLRSLKTDPNYADFGGLQIKQKFQETLQSTLPAGYPDLRTTIYWDTGYWYPERFQPFTLSDDTGKFIYHLIAVSSTGEVMNLKGEFEIDH